MMITTSIQHEGVEIHPTARIEVSDLQLGKGTKIGAYATITGRKVHIGRDGWIGDHTVIGGGSAWDPQAFLVAGDFLHLGVNGEINTARGVTIGDEVGLGVQTRIFTHGAYLDELAGFPVNFDGVTICDRVWIPNGQVNAGSVLGRDSVYIPGSVVTGVFPGHSLIGGNPAKVIKRDVYPKALTLSEKTTIVNRIVEEAYSILVGQGCGDVYLSHSYPLVHVGDTCFDVDARVITGPATGASAVVKDQFRRHGVRFRFDVVSGVYTPWF